MSTTNNILKEMRPALVNAHNANNAKVISKDFAAGSGVSERAYTNWVTWVDSLHYKVTPWAAKWNDGKVTDEEIQAIYDDVMPILRAISRVDDKLFIRTNDVGAICKMAHNFGKSENGSVDIVTGKKAFRRMIETMVGNRIAQNEALSEDNYTTIVKYERAVKNKEKAEARLDGYVDAKGAKVEGLKEQLKKAKETLSTMEALAIEMGADKKTIKDNPIVGAYQAQVTTLENTIKATEGNIDKAKTTIKELGKEYKAIMAKIAEIK